MLDLIITLHGEEWAPRRAAFTALSRLCVGATLKLEKLADRKVSLACVLAGDELLQALNRDYRGKDAPTNVLSFPNLTPPELKAALRWKQPLVLGDLIFSGDAILRQAADQGKEPSHHLAHLLVHGCLHLLGYDHEHDRDAARMERREIAILKRLGVKNPYA